MPVSYKISPKLPESDRIALGKLLETFYSKFPGHVAASDSVLSFQPTLNPDIKGLFNPQNSSVTIFQDSTRSQNSLLSTTLHELTHQQQLAKPMYGVTKDRSVLDGLKRAAQLKLSSSSDPSEVLADAETSYHLEKAGLPSVKAPQLKQLTTEFPELNEYIKKNRLIP